MSPHLPTDEKFLLDALMGSEVLVLATQSPAGGLHATPLCYACIGGFAAPCLVFASNARSEHARHLGEGSAAVAAGTHVPHRSVDEIRGTQLRGEVWPIARCATPQRRLLRSGYLTRFPMAAALLAKSLVAPPERRERLYVLAVGWAKLTDNARLGMGVHREWSFASVRKALGLDAGSTGTEPKDGL